MKKVLVLVLVLGLASLANAMTLQISVDGNLNPVDSQIVLLPSQTAVLNIHSADGFTPGSGVYFGLVCDPAFGTISGGVVHMPPAPDASMLLPATDMASYFPGSGIYGSIDSWAGSGGATAGTYFDGITFHCEKIGDAVIVLYSTDFAGAPVELDRVTIHQVPEPASMLLLSLGGLLLRRFKK